MEIVYTQLAIDDLRHPETVRKADRGKDLQA
jgi:hypothetical protein